MNNTMTTIALTKETRERMRDNKITNRESYEEIINRVLDKLEEGQE